jgi:hypothetical protein
MSAPDDEAAQLRKVFRATLANSGWGPETIGRANSLALALWETEQRDERRRRRVQRLQFC